MSSTKINLTNIKETLKANRPAIQSKLITFTGATVGLLLTSAITNRLRHHDTIIIVPVDAAGNPVAPSQAAEPTTTEI